MKIRIFKRQEWTFWPLLILFILSCEKIYNQSYISGKYNVQVTLIFFLVSLVLFATKKIRLYRSDLISIAIITLVVLYGFCKESIRYGLVLFSLFAWNKVKVKNVDVLQRSLVIAAVVFSMADYLLGYERISGFSSGSPILFSCAIAVCLIYFLFKTERTKSDYFYSVVCFVLAYKTESSSTIIFMIALIAYKVVINILIKFGWKSWITKLCIIVAIVAVATILVFNLDSALGIINRGNREASTLTRLGIYQEFTRKWLISAKTFLFGYGGGFTQQYIRQYWGAISHMPLHQDILMFICEYGFIGFWLIYRYIIKKCNMNFIMLLALVLGSFHNIILSPMTLLLLVITSNAINEQYGKTGVLWK